LVGGKMKLFSAIEEFVFDVLTNILEEMDRRI